MSRIGRKPISIPAGVEFKVEDSVVTVKGPKGTLTQKVHPNMSFSLEDGVLTVIRPDDAKENRALHGLTRSLVSNMVIGVTEGFNKQLVGQFAAEVREKRPPEPYKGKGIKYVDEVVRRKEGKAGGKGKK